MRKCKSNRLDFEKSNTVCILKDTVQSKSAILCIFYNAKISHLGAFFSDFVYHCVALSSCIIFWEKRFKLNYLRLVLTIRLCSLGYISCIRTCSIRVHSCYTNRVIIEFLESCQCICNQLCSRIVHCNIWSVDIVIHSRKWISIHLYRV